MPQSRRPYAERVTGRFGLTGVPGPPDLPSLGTAEGRTLAALASAAIRARLIGAAFDAGALPAGERWLALRRPGASFVTLEVAGALRGCVGTLEPVRPLYLDVTRNATNATSDPRLPPVTADEWSTLDITVSVLSPLESLPVTGLSQLLATVRPGVDGLILTDGTRRATFLPTVWAKLAEPDTFIAALLAKGGWSSWPARVRVARYTVVEFANPAPRPPLGPDRLAGCSHD